ncbi:MAG: Uma2 family endonuclease [Gemmatimonadota bacterium]
MIPAAAGIVFDAELRIPCRRADIMAMPITAPRYTVDQVRGFPPDGQRYELLDGVLLVTPAPRHLHQVVVGHLFAQLYQGVVPSRMARVVSIGELEVGNLTLLNPDILVYPARYGPDIPWKLMREWWLAVEVLSPSSRVYDRDFKRQAYQAVGVEAVWLVDPDACSVEIWEQGSAAPRIERDTIEWRGVRIDLGVVWER